MKKQVTIYLDESHCDLIDELAREQRRTRANFIDQFLRVSLTEGLDRAALVEKMNPALTSMLPAIRQERDRIAGLFRQK